MAEKRLCGGCTACCKTHPILEINNPARVWCPHCEISKGCKIYETRPQGCRDFACQWLMGGGADDERPDKVKVVVDYLDIPGFGEVTMIHEVTEGALQNPYANRVLKRRMQLVQPVCLLPVIGSNTLYIPQKMFFSGFGSFGRINDRETYIIQY